MVRELARDYTRPWMGKRPDKPDSTQPLSESQVVAVTQKPPDHAIPKNDRSVWKGMVVGADEFSPQPKRSKKRWAVIAALGVVAGGAGIAGYEMYSGSAGGTGSGSGERSGSGSGSGSAVVMPATRVPADAPAPPPVDAAVPIDAAAPIDAGAPPDAAPAPKPVKKKRVQRIRKGH